MRLNTFRKYNIFFQLLSFSLLLTNCSSDDELAAPSPKNDFLDKDYFHYQFDGREEYEYADKIYVNTPKEVSVTTGNNLISGPNTRLGFGEFGSDQSEGFLTSYFFWLPIRDNQIQELILPNISETTSFIGYPGYTSQDDRLFQLSFYIREENTSWSSLDSEEWLDFSSDNFQQKNYHILKNITLIDSSDSKVNVYKIEGEFEANLNYEGTTILKPIYGKYRIELVVYK